MDSEENPDNCVICSKVLDPNKISIYEQNPLSGKRLLIKIFEVTKVDFLEGFLCSNCHGIISTIEKLETEFNLSLVEKGTEKFPEAKSRQENKNLEGIKPEIKEESGSINNETEEDKLGTFEDPNIEEDPEITEIEKQFKIEPISVEKSEYDLDSLMDEEESVDMRINTPIWPEPEGKEPIEDNNQEPEYPEEFSIESHPVYRKKNKQKLADIQCMGCNKIFKEKYQLERHLEGERKRGKEHDGKCTDCGEVYTKWDDLKKHIDTKHKGELKYKCGYCDETFVSLIIYKSHTRTTMNACPKKLEALNKEKRVCPICAKSYFGDQALRHHTKWSHETTGDYTCEECGKVFYNESKFRSHMKKQHDPITCEECGKICKSKVYYDTHWGINHMKMEDRPFQCSKCDKGFLEQRTHDIHMNTHTGERPFKCKFENCDRAFPDPSTVSQHEKRLHLGIRSTKKKVPKAMK